MHRSGHVIIVSAVTMLALICGGCGESPPAGNSSGDNETAATAKRCSAFPADLIRRYAIQKQLLLTLSMAQGRNLGVMRETSGAPEPETFRQLGKAFENFNAAGIEAVPNFDQPGIISRDLGRTADLLAAALTADESTTEAAWAALSEFYSQAFFVRHNASITYYLDEAGCI